MMTADDFTILVRTTRQAQPHLFELESDPPATEEEIAVAEADLNVRFPAEYRAFVLRYGGGYFGYTNVFSVRRGSEWNMVARTQAATVPANFLPISDNGCGDFYGFLTDPGGVCESAVYFCDHEEGCRQASAAYAELFDYLAQVGLKRGPQGPARR